MLCVTRKTDEVIRIGPDVLVKVLGIVIDGQTGKRKVRLGIEAPRHVAIFRDELLRDGEPLPDAPPMRKAVDHAGAR